jgi:murein DD-endopeptidase MepM/ murein hydrolase activator NlpD
MSADANSAFGRQLGSQRVGNFQPDNRDLQGSLPISSTQSDGSVKDPGAVRDSSPFANRQTSPIAGVQVAPAQGAEWLDTYPVSSTSVDGIVTKIHRYFHLTLADQVTPVRLASHLSVLAVAALVLIFSRLEVPDWNLSLQALPESLFFGETGGAGAQIASSVRNEGVGVVTANESLQRATVPFTIIHEKPQQHQEIQSYIVQAGDTVLGIAEKFGLQPETLQWSNPGIEANPDVIRPGDTLNILPVNGVLHTVTSGDNLSSIAMKYKVSVEDIVNYQANQLTDASASLVLGMKLVIPGGTKPFAYQQVVTYSGGAAPATASKGSGAFVWPTSGSINQRYYAGHPGIDVGAWTGAPVKAADGGYVAVATGGWNGGYGNHVIVDHGNGFVTLYAHLNSIIVRPGENIARGQQVGTVGVTGNSTGPHLHFEIRYQGVPRNPFSYLP